MEKERSGIAFALMIVVGFLVAIGWAIIRDTTPQAHSGGHPVPAVPITNPSTDPLAAFANAIDSCDRGHGIQPFEVMVSRDSIKCIYSPVPPLPVVSVAKKAAPKVEEVKPQQ